MPQETSASEFGENTDTALISELAEESTTGETEEERAFLIMLSGPRVGQMRRVDDPEIELGRRPESDFRVDDRGVSRRHSRLVRGDDAIWIEDLDSSNGTFLNGDEIEEPHQLEDGDKITLGGATILKFTYQDPLEEKFQQQMYEASLRDSLTDAYNRDYLHDYLESEISYAERHGAQLSLVLFDLDHFKEVNDTYGHVAGDRVLREIADRIRGEIRTEDVLSRYGGEEFAVVCRGVGLEGASTLAERLRRAVGRTEFDIEGDEVGITISVGVACYSRCAPEKPAGLIEAADRALYRAKDAGRNTVRKAR